LYAGSTKVMVGSDYAIDAALHDALKTTSTGCPRDAFYSLPSSSSAHQNDYLRGGMLNDKLTRRPTSSCGHGRRPSKGGKGADELYGGSD
jgi:hypothetical protein